MTRFCIFLLLALGCAGEPAQGDDGLSPSPAPDPSSSPAGQGAGGGDGSGALSTSAGSEVQPDQAVRVSWKLAGAEAGDALRVEYELTNDFTEVVFVCAELLQRRGGEVTRQASRLILRQGETGDRADLVCGARQPRERLNQISQPVYQRLEPGESVSFVKAVPSPVEAWHNLGTLPELTPETREIRLIVDYFIGEPSQWVELEFADQSKAQVPKGAGRRYQAQGEALEIPQPAAD